MNEPRASTNPTPLPDANADALTGAPGAHPVGVGIGAVSAGAVVGAAAGLLGGPIGVVAGAAIGAVAGGFAGKAAAESINPTDESAYWLQNHSTRPYALTSYPYDEYAPAYRYGWESYANHGTNGRTFDEAEPLLAKEWDRVKGPSRLAWDQAKHATRDAWNRVHTTSTPTERRIVD